MLDLEKTSPQQKLAAENAAVDKTLLTNLLDGLISKSKEVRYENFKALYALSNVHPDALYGHWGFFEDFLRSNDDSKRFYAVHILANLARADCQGRFEGLFDDFYGILKGNALIPACHVAYVSGKIVASKPELADKVTARLLDLEGATYKHPELVKANAAKSLAEFYDKITSKDQVAHFVQELKQNKSAKVKKEASDFIKKWKIT
jgi:hypothetical protein